MTTPIRELLLKIWEDNDYVLTFQATQEVRDITTELKRVWDIQKPDTNDSRVTGTVLEPLLGYITGFITQLDKDISKEISKESSKEISKEISKETTAQDDGCLWYLEDIKHGAVASRDRIVDWQLETIKNI
jgi:hypothetical protein